MKRVTKKRGYIILTVPNRLNLALYYDHKKRMREQKTDFGYEYFYTPWELRRILVRNNLKIIRFISELWLVGGYKNYLFRIFNRALQYFGGRMGYLAQKR